MSSPSSPPPSESREQAHERLERAIADASSNGVYDSVEVCEAVEQVVDEAKGVGDPPERVLVRVKQVAHGILAHIRVPAEGFRALIAWIVRCAIRAYYGDTQRKGV